MEGWSGGGDVVLVVCIVDWWDAVGVDTVVHGAWSVVLAVNAW